MTASATDLAHASALLAESVVGLVGAEFHLALSLGVAITTSLLALQRFRSLGRSRA